MDGTPQPLIGGARMGPAVMSRDKVRLYEGAGDWFRTGLVTDVDVRAGTADVDFCDWIQRYDLRDLRPSWPADGSYERCLIPQHAGTTIEDYREE